MRRPVEFWFDFASTYSYVAALRIGREAGEQGVEVVWRPFLLGPIFSERLGITDSPFNLQPARRDYMWRDLERLCAEHGLPWRRPSVFPRRSTLAARVSIVALAEGWGVPLVEALFRANFAEDADIGSPEVVGAAVQALGQKPAAVLARAESAEYRPALRSRTAEALRRGVFGAPTFFVKDEPFFGQDRLTQTFAAALGTAKW